MLRLLRRWLHSRGTVSDDAYFWTLPEEVSPESWTFALINAWMQEILSVLQVHLPLGCSWSSHSLRSGGASAAYALGVDLLVIMNWGLWSSLDSLHLYVDVLVQPDAGTVLFFAHLLWVPCPPPWRSSFVMAVSVCIVYLGVMCVFLLTESRALVFLTVSDTPRRRFFFYGTLSIANR